MRFVVESIRGEQLADEIYKAIGVEVVYSFIPPDVLEIAGVDEYEEQIAEVVAGHVPDRAYFPEDVIRERRNLAVGDYPGVLAGKTAEEAEAWVEANVVDLASTRVALKMLARAVVALARRGDIEDG